MSWSRRDVVIASVVSVVIAAGMGLLLPVYMDRRAWHGNDPAVYVWMARHPTTFAGHQFGVVGLKFGFRILGPWIAHILPVSAPVGLLVLTVFGWAAAGGLLYIYLRLAAIGRHVAVIGTALFAFSYGPVASLGNPFDVDGLSCALLMGALVLLRLRRISAFGLVVAIGVLARESLLMLLLPAAALGWTRPPYRPRRDWLILALLPLLAYGLIHDSPLLFGRVEKTFAYASLDNIRDILHFRAVTDHGLWRSIAWALLQSFGPLWFAAAWGWRRACREFRLIASLLLPIAATLLIASDWSRMLAYAFPVVIPLVCCGVWRRWAQAALCALMALNATLLLGVWPIHATLLIYSAVSAIGALVVLAGRDPQRQHAEPDQARPTTWPEKTEVPVA